MKIYRVQQGRPEYSHWMPKAYFLKKEDALRAAKELQSMAAKGTTYIVDSVEVH